MINTDSKISYKFDNGIKVKLHFGAHLFQNGSSTYNHTLALCALTLCQAAEMSRDEIENRLKSFGFGNIVSHFFESNLQLDKPAVSFASTATVINGKPSVIEVVTVRGTGNSDLGDAVTDVINGFLGIGLFRKSAKNVLRKFFHYHRSLTEHYGFKVNPDNTILFITGHSLGGAVAGQLARLSEHITARKQNTYIYTFASPKYAVTASPERYNNVFNIINRQDLVPHFPRQGARYGRDLFFNSRQIKPAVKRLYSNENTKDDVVWHYHLPVTYLACMAKGLPKPKFKWKQ